MISRRHFLLGLAAAGLPLRPALALAASQGPEAALIASFTCAKCAKFDPIMGSLEKQLGQKLHFVPVSENLDNAVVLGWYALRNRVKDPAHLRAALFTLTQKMLMPDPSPDDLIQFLQLEGFEIPADEMRVAIEAQATRDLSQRAINLVAASGVEYTPAVVFVQGKSVLKVVENVEMNEAAFMSAVVAAKREMRV